MTGPQMSRGRSRRSRLLAVSVAAVVLLTGVAIPGELSAAGDHTVDMCASDSQVGPGINLDTALDMALGMGGQISFDCPAGAVIAITSSKRITADSVIDGSNHGRGVTLLHAIPEDGLIESIFEVLPGGSLELTDISLVAGGASTMPGAVQTQGALRMVGSTVDGFYRGISAEAGDVTIANDTFRGNNFAVTFDARVAHGLVRLSRFLGNSRGVGGAVSFPGQAAPPTSFVVSRSYFDGNDTAIQHCASDDCPTPLALTVADSIVVGGPTTDPAVLGTGITLLGDTITRNAGPGVEAWAGGTIRLAGTIVTDNAGGECVGPVAGDQHDLQWPDASCAGVLSADPRLSALLEPLTGSPAIAGADPAVCSDAALRGIDYYGQARSTTGACSIGAVEHVLRQPPVVPATAPPR